MILHGQMAPQPKFAEGLLFDTMRGFFLASPASFSVLDPQSLAHRDDPWIQLIACLEIAKSGDFRRCDTLVNLVSRDCVDPTMWHAWSTLVGHVCPIDLVQQSIVAVASQFPDGLPYYVCDHLSNMIVSTQQMSLVPWVVKWCMEWQGTATGDVLCARLGTLLEPKPADISSGRLPRSEWTRLVNRTVEGLVDAAGSRAVSVRAGELFSPVRTAKIMQMKLHDEASDFEDFIDDRMIFEATTGIDLSACFVNGALAPLTAAAILEDALERIEGVPYQPGSRCFFGHLIPVE